MSEEESTAASQSDGTVSSEQVFSHSKDPIRTGRIKVQMVQNVLLIWLDNNIDDNSADCRYAITRLRRAVNNINIFTDGEQCIEFLKRMHNDKACMVISGALGQQVVPRVHSMSQVDSIFIFCDNKQYHEQWVKKWPKIKGVFTEISPICEALKQTVQQCEQDAIPMSFMTTDDDMSKKNLDQLDPSFMYTTIMKEILLIIQFEQKHFIEFIQYCREALVDNEGELEKVKQFEQEYCNESPIWWYTFECFLYPMLNRALRLMDVDMIIKMGFFIGDLHRDIEKLHKEQFVGHKSNESFIVYRGQGMSNTEFEKLTKTKGGLISFNNFLSTSKDHNVSLNFARHALPNQDLVGILFVMIIDPSKSRTPFASITDVSYFKEKEEEVLFAMHTVFRINEMKPMDEDHRLIQVNLTLTDDNDKDLRALTDRIREETFPDEEGWERLGLLLLKIGQSDRAQQVYEILLQQKTEESEKAFIYHQLGWTQQNRGEYREAITFYEKSLEIYKNILSLNHPDLANSYNNIGNVYQSMGEYSKALSSHEKALAIRQQSLSTNHPDLANSYNNIGAVYENMGQYSKALSSYEKALGIRQQSLPPNHPDLASLYGNIGLIYMDMGKHSNALCFLEKTLEIQKKTLPLNHPTLALSYNNIGAVYESMGDYSEARSFYEHAVDIGERSLPLNHPDLAFSYGNIGLTSLYMGEHSNALSFLEKTLDIQKKTLSLNHPTMAFSYNNIGAVYENIGDYSEASSFYERAVNIGQQSLPLDHPELQKWRDNLDRVKKKL